MKNTTIAYVTIEAAALRVDAREIIHTAATQGSLLAEIGHGAHEAVIELSASASAEEVRSAVARVRGSVLHGFSVLAEIQAQAGRLEQLASVLEAQQRD